MPIFVFFSLSTFGYIPCGHLGLQNGITGSPSPALPAQFAVSGSCECQKFQLIDLIHIYLHSACLQCWLAQDWYIGGWGFATLVCFSAMPSQPRENVMALLEDCFDLVGLGVW